MQAAEFAAKLRAARAEHDGNVDASADSQIASSAARHRLDGQNVSGAGMRAPPGRDSASCDLCFDARAGERKCHIPAEAEPEREHRDFDSGGGQDGSKNVQLVCPMACQPLGPGEAETPVCDPPIDTEPPAERCSGVCRRGMVMRGSMPPR